MNKTRWFKILKNLSQSEYISSEILGKKLNLSSKTVRNELKKMKSVLEYEGAQLISKTKRGYLIKIEDSGKYKRFLDSLVEKNVIPETSLERIQFLLETLLVNSNQYVKLEDLCNQIFISRSSLTADLKEVKKALKEYNLDLITRPGYGMRIQGREHDFRLCIAANDIWKDEEDDEKKKCLSQISICVQEGLLSSNLKLSDISYQNLTIHIYIMLKRIKQKCYISLEQENTEIVKNSIEFTCAKKIINLLKKSFSISIPDEEVSYIAIHIASKRIIDSSENSNVVINSEVNNIVTNMLDEIKKSYNISFHNDLELRMNLSMHLIPFAMRMQHGIHLKNPLINDIKKHYSQAYLITLVACDVLKKQYNKDIQDDEIAYFALYFNLALERKRKQVPKKNIVIVCSTGRSSSQLLAWKMREELGHYLDRIETCDLFEMKNYDCKKIDYVVTTVPIPFKISRPILHIESFLEENSVRALRSLLHGKGVSSLSKYFSSNLFINDLEADSRTEAIRLIVKHIKSVKKIPESFLKSVLKREKMGFTEFGNMVAIPHPNELISDETFVCVAVLKKAILWNKKKVKIIFMFSLKKSPDDNVEYFSRVISKLLFNIEYIQEIIKNPKYSTLLKLLEKIEMEVEEKQ